MHEVWWSAVLAGILHFAGFFPIAVAWRANRRTSLSHAVWWAAAAWLALGSFALEGFLAEPLPPSIGRYPAWCLAGCTVLAVFGARRPALAAWDAVAGALLCVLLLPTLESVVAGSQFEAFGVRQILLLGWLTLGVANYLPTRFAPAACLFGLVAAIELFETGGGGFWLWRRLLVALIPWLAWACKRRAVERPDFQVRWLDFRDRFGAVWSLPAMEQFNQASKNAAWPVVMVWRGVSGPAEFLRDKAPEIDGLLRRLLTRFGAKGE